MLDKNITHSIHTYTMEITIITYDLNATGKRYLSTEAFFGSKNTFLAYLLGLFQ